VSDYTYLNEISSQLIKRDYQKFLQIWEEYCTSDQVDVEEFALILKAIKNSDFQKQFGKMVETALPIWETISDREDSYKILKQLIDLETTHSPQLADLVLKTLKDRYGNDPDFNEKIRLIGLRTMDHFQGALSNFDLLSHMQKGNFVLHPSGWGAGEIMEISPLRQQVTVEFENVSGKKQLTFENAFKALQPLNSEHFLARRFATPDDLEKEAKDNPIDVLKLLLKDLGPKNASEIKDELCELVIPEEDWAKWWQAARNKLKKDPLIESPENLKDPFKLRKTEISNAERLSKAFKKKGGIDETIQSAYSFLRDAKSAVKNDEVKKALEMKLVELLSNPEMTKDQEMQILITLEEQFQRQVPGHNLKDLIQSNDHIEKVIDDIEIVALKKRALILVKELRSDWVPIFKHLFLQIKHSAIRDYILKELQQDLNETLQNLLEHPERNPDCFLWYFNKVLEKKEALTYQNSEGRARFFESLLILLNRVESKAENKDLTKKIYVLLTGDRYALVREIMEEATLEDVKEYLLLAAKCHTFTDHDIKILHSLASVAHPKLSKGKKVEEDQQNVVWTTEKGYLAVQEKIKHIGTVEVVENAKEIEAARALGDLRENSEYKFAQERRHRLQGQLKELSSLLNKARIITEEDISLDKVGVGTIVKVTNEKGDQNITYTILGPWDADPDANILSFQSKLAQSMMGCKVGDSFQFREETYFIKGIKSYLKG
jgi:transcription elongation factor GreA